MSKYPKTFFWMMSFIELTISWSLTVVVKGNMVVNVFLCVFNSFIVVNCFMVVDGFRLPKAHRIIWSWHVLPKLDRTWN